MKTKNVFYIFFAFVLLAFGLDGKNVSQTKTPDEVLQNIMKLDETLKTETPMQLSMRSFKGLFAEKTTPNVDMRARSSSMPSRTSLFNKSFLKYIREIYNEHNYAEVLSQNGTHVIEFLDICTELNLDADATYVCMRLFYNKIKAAELVDDSMLNQLLPYFPQHLDRFFMQKEGEQKAVDLSFIKKSIESMLITKFTEQLPEFQQKPDAFVSGLSAEIIKLMQRETDRVGRLVEKYDARERLRQVIIRFLDIALNKVIWNPKAPEGIWQSFLGLANGLQTLGAYDIINHMDDLDDLLWSLTYRFCFFLDLTGSVLPLEFFEEVERDLSNSVVFFLEVKEQDAGIKSKKEILATALLQAKTKAIAFQRQGIFSQPF